MNEAKSAFLWDGSDNKDEIITYTTGLGARDTATTAGDQPTLVLNLSKDDASAIMALYRRQCASVVVPEVSDLAYNAAQVATTRLVQRIDKILPESSQGFFLKTNRHSCKDSPVDHPTESDIARFRDELASRGSASELPLGTNLDDIDFGPAFEAFCSARLRSTAVHNGEEALSLLTRSRMTHEDLNLQLESDSPWDLYLAFLPFMSHIADTPLHEFRCYVSRGSVRCVAQYSYFHQCPIPAKDMPAAGSACSLFVQSLMPSLPGGVQDVAVDVRCILEEGQFNLSLIEVNPLGPGCVWGTLYWEHDREWLLGRSPVPLDLPRSVEDAAGNTTQYVMDEANKVVVAFTSEHAKGFSMGGLAHMPAPFLLEMHDAWGLDRLVPQAGPTLSQCPEADPCTVM